MIIAQIVLTFEMIAAAVGALGLLLLLPADAIFVTTALIGVPAAVFVLASDTFIAVGAVIAAIGLLLPLIGITGIAL